MSIRSSYEHRNGGKTSRVPLTHCAVDGCGGVIVRHSLGCGISIRRCIRCLARYFASGPAVDERPSWRGAVLHEFLKWREDD